MIDNEKPTAKQIKQVSDLLGTFRNGGEFLAAMAAVYRTEFEAPGIANTIDVWAAELTELDETDA